MHSCNATLCHGFKLKSGHPSAGETHQITKQGPSFHQYIVRILKWVRTCKHVLPSLVCPVLEFMAWFICCGQRLRRCLSKNRQDRIPTSQLRTMSKITSSNALIDRGIAQEGSDLCTNDIILRLSTVVGKVTQCKYSKVLKSVSLNVHRVKCRKGWVQFV
jgi:hypothetical protein